MSKKTANGIFHVRPRDVANKASREVLIKSIEMALAMESEPVRRNTETFSQHTYSAIKEIEDYELLREQVRTIKEQAIDQVEESIKALQKAIEQRGGHFYLAKGGNDASVYIRDICKKHQAKFVVKAKSMTSEEIHLNRFLEEAGIEVAETDLAEFILQAADEQPSHITAPAIHRSRESISELFTEKFHPEEPLETGESLTNFARKILRQKFLTADVGISGANMIAADTGTIVLVENEGNIRMVTQAPSIHIAVAGIEKILPHWENLAPFIELLAPSATGQAISQYTNILHPPLKLRSFSFDGRPKREREFYLVVVDNGRFRMRDDEVLKEALYCIRCSACMNVCPVFQVLGGHAFGGETYSGGIGGAWEAGTGTLLNARFSELCTGCSRCVPRCPAKIDIPWLNMVLQDRLNQVENKRNVTSKFVGKLLGSKGYDKSASLEKQFFGNYSTIAKLGSTLSPFSNVVNSLAPVRSVMEKTVGLDHRRSLPRFSRRTFVKEFEVWQRKEKQKEKILFQIKDKSQQINVLLFVDGYTNFIYPESGMAAVKIFNSLGINVALSKSFPDGRAALSQGMITTASVRAKETAYYLEKEIDSGWEIGVVEPSILALFHQDYKNLLDEEFIFEKIKQNSFGVVEFLFDFIEKNNIPLKKIFDVNKSSWGKRLFYHDHCQRKSQHAVVDIAKIFETIGFDVVTSDVECCGMAGSFGYKKEFYEVSMKIGEKLFNQIKEADGDSPRILTASGVSCRQQIKEGVGRNVFHPMEVLAEILNTKDMENA